MEQHRNLPAEKIVNETISSRQFNKDENLNRICKDDSALHLSLFETAISARREKAQDDNFYIARKKPRQFNIISNKYN